MVVFPVTAIHGGVFYGGVFCHSHMVAFSVKAIHGGVFCHSYCVLCSQSLFDITMVLCFANMYSSCFPKCTFFYKVLIYFGCSLMYMNMQIMFLEREEGEGESGTCLAYLVLETC